MQEPNGTPYEVGDAGSAEGTSSRLLLRGLSSETDFF